LALRSASWRHQRYILTGIGVFVALLASVAQQYIAQKAESPSARDRLSARRQRRQGE
jgi:F0F1-type ATP synthase membrane subunit c/vacuolar-type H+-ATPase subunit K